MGGSGVSRENSVLLALYRMQNCVLLLPRKVRIEILRLHGALFRHDVECRLLPFRSKVEVVLNESAMREITQGATPPCEHVRRKGGSHRTWTWSPRP